MEPKDRVGEALVKVYIDSSDQERFFLIGSSLSPEDKVQFVSFLQENLDVFAWSPHEMPGVDISLASHELHVNPNVKPIAQKQRRLSEERAQAVTEEVAKLLKAGFIREIPHSEWLANPVCVMKKTGGWRVAIDYTDINKHCPKDNFPLPKIDQLIDSIAGYARLSILDAYSGYHQVRLRASDQEKTTFITPCGVFCYNVMPFGLKNAGATYQRLVSRMFEGLNGKILEAYVDDTIVKSRKAEDHIQHLAQVFAQLRRYGMKLNA